MTLVNDNTLKVDHVISLAGIKARVAEIVEQEEY
jgi:hypothetical protein